MRNATTWAVGTLVLAGALSACGSGSSGSSGSAGAPTAASKTAFCQTFTDLGAGTTPQEAATKLSEVGTPSGIDSGARHGFEVLVDHLRALPAKAKDSDLTAMAKDLKAGDQADVVSFLTYYADECQNLSGAVPSSPSTG
jgi:hypothetical protein